MGSNIDVTKLKRWMQRNYWEQDRSNKHEVWILEIINDETGDTLQYDSLNINMHRTKGAGISERALTAIASKMFITKHELVEMIRNKKDIDYKNYIK